MSLAVETRAWVETSSSTLFAFDYSGTLSRGAVTFAEPGNLARELARSGLAGLGVADPAEFWERIVNPSWESANVTTTGYAALIADLLVKLARERRAAVRPRAFAAAAGRFVAAYMAASDIHPAWIPLLRRLCDRPGAGFLVATDHYAEATSAILGHLRRAGVPAYPEAGHAQHGCAAVANSADLGAVKESPKFWRGALGLLPHRSWTRAVLVDDFGQGERPEDAYADAAKVSARRTASAGAIAAALGADVSVVRFEPTSGAYEDWDAEIRRVADLLLADLGVCRGEPG
ncbi:MAG TPA: hypothetical protein VLH39_08495 [Magnetospirillaceae bacterium]|nr:hypothetical protein [Magnetospirillaceae bacterium]